MEKLSEEEICKVVDLLIGEVEPAGDSRIDRDWMVNIEHLTNLIDHCLDRVSYAANYSNHDAYSMREVGRYALRYLAESAAWFNDKKKRWDNESLTQSNSI